MYFELNSYILHQHTNISLVLYQIASCVSKELNYALLKFLINFGIA